MFPPLKLMPITALDGSMDELSNEAAREGFAFLDRLVRDWKVGANRFNGPGEQLLGAFVAERLVGIGGLNREPYDPAPRRARLRHLYVLRDFRRRGVARELVRRLLIDSVSAFDEVRLRTNAAEAELFYQSLGFQPVPLPTATHIKRLGGEAI